MSDDELELEADAAGDGPKVRQSRALSNPDYLTVRQAARALGGVSVHTVYRLLKAGRLAGVRVGGCWRVSRAAVDRALAPPAAPDSPAPPQPKVRGRRSAAPPGGFQYLRHPRS